MESLRRDLAGAVGEAAATARQWRDWRYYVKRFPWASGGAALLVGYLIVPKRINVLSPDIETLAELAKRKRFVVRQEVDTKRSDRTIAGTLMGLLTVAATRALVSHVGGWLATKSTNELFQKGASQKASAAPQRPK